MVKPLLLAVLVCAGCAENFEDPSIVLDLRALGVRATPPEVVVDVDVGDPFALATAELVDVEVCALVADPAASRRLAFEVAICAPTDSGRCDDPDATRVPVGTGEIADPDESAPAQPVCATIAGDADLWDVLAESLRADALAGFGGLAVQVEIAVGPAGGEPIHATKRVLYSPRIPESRVANTNPELDAVLADGRAIAAGRCAEAGTDPVLVAPGQVIELSVLEAAGAREPYVLPTLDGGERQFLENLSFAWFAEDGLFSAETTGGPIDPFGSEPPVKTTWTSPEDLEPGAAIDLWVVARDERGGAVWYPICVRHNEDDR